MSYVTKVTEEQAGPETQTLFREIREHYGFLPNYFQALGKFPEVIEKHNQFGQSILKDGALPAAIKEEIMLLVSGVNSSSYCIAIHMQILQSLGVEPALGRKLATDYKRAPVGEKEMALFRYAEKLTRDAVHVSDEDVEGLRKLGWSDEAIVEAALVVAWANFINRVSLGLGLVGEHATSA